MDSVAARLTGAARLLLCLLAGQPPRVRSVNHLAESSAVGSHAEAEGFARLVRPSWSLAVVVLVISMGLGLLVAGETEFNLAGFVIVMVASALSGLRWTITQVLLQGDAKHSSAPLHPPGAAGSCASSRLDRLSGQLVV